MSWWIELLRRVVSIIYPAGLMCLCAWLTSGRDMREAAANARSLACDYLIGSRVALTNTNTQQLAAAGSTYRNSSHMQLYIFITALSMD